MGDQTTFRFGELEAILADINEIESVNRTSFQARLKDFQRRDLLRMDALPKGKAATYGIRELMLLAIGIELCQLGLSTERATNVILDDEFPLWMAVMMGANAIETRPEVFNPGPGDTGNPPDQELWGFSSDWADAVDTDPLSVFLYLDPAALSPWVDVGGAKEGEKKDPASMTFFYAGRGIVAESLHRWTTGPSRRIALINVTSLIFTIAAYMKGIDGLKFVKEVAEIAQAWVHRGDFDLDGWLINVAKTMGGLASARPTLQKEIDGRKTSWIPLKHVFDEFPADHVFRRFITWVEPEPQEEEWMRDYSSPDMIIRLPGHRSLMVDTKIGAMADIPQVDIWDRVEELSNQPYRTKYTDRTDYIILYIPDEHLYATAVAAGKKLFDHALEKKVILATPAVFINIIAEAANAWDKYRKEFPDMGEDEWESLPDEDLLPALKPDADDQLALPKKGS